MPLRFNKPWLLQNWNLPDKLNVFKLEDHYIDQKEDDNEEKRI
jgi:hypothetical protein